MAEHSEGIFTFLSDVKNVSINNAGLFCLRAVCPPLSLAAEDTQNRPPIALCGTFSSTANLNIRCKHSACISGGTKAA